MLLCGLKGCVCWRKLEIKRKTGVGFALIAIGAVLAVEWAGCVSSFIAEGSASTQFAAQLTTVMLIFLCEHAFICVTSDLTQSLSLPFA